MDFQIVQKIDGDLDAVEAALVDPAFLVRMTELPKLGSAEVINQERDGDVVRQQVRYLFEADLSGAVTKVVDPKLLTWVEDSTCDLASHRTTCKILPDHYQDLLSARFDAEMTADGGQTIRTISGSLKVKILLVGGRVERSILGGLEENAVAQAALIAAWIAAK